MSAEMRMTIRRMGFAYPPAMKGHWNRKRPEFSQLVNAASLAMPYLEPYLIRTMRKARPLVREDALRIVRELRFLRLLRHANVRPCATLPFSAGSPT